MNYDKALLPQRVNEYIAYLNSVKDDSKLTVDGYVTDLRLFFEFEARKKGMAEKDSEEKPDLSFIDDDFLSQITLSDLHEFVSFCKEERNNSSVTRARKVSALRGFFKFVSERMGYIKNNPAAQLQISPSKKKLPLYLSLEQSRSLLSAVDGKNKVRDYCILTLFLNCGLRLAELVSLNVNDIDLEQKKMRVIGKGNKERVVYINNACVDAVKAYLEIRPKDRLKGDDRNALFISRINKRIGRQAVQDVVYNNLKKIGLDGSHYSVHKLRHTAATLMYQYADADLLVIKDMLGHENLSTTEIYTHLENKQLRSAVENNPLSNESKSDENNE